MDVRLRRTSFTLFVLSLLLSFGGSISLYAQDIPNDAILHAIDASVSRRENNLLGYTVTEHYSVYHGEDTQHPTAEMTVKTTYQKDSGKTYQILSESGSALLRKEVLERMLDSEREVTQPATRARALIDSNNYEMTVADHATIDGRPCVQLHIAPHHSATYLFKGSLWVDARDGSIVRLEGTTAKPASILAGPTKVSRQYTLIESYPMATHAEASTSVMMLGQMQIDLDYSGYILQIRPTAPPHPAEIAPAP